MICCDENFLSYLTIFSVLANVLFISGYLYFFHLGS